jgi:hypothetical protein
MLRAVLDRSSGVGDGFLVLRGTWRRICESVDLAAVREGGEGGRCKMCLFGER